MADDVARAKSSGLAVIRDVLRSDKVTADHVSAVVQTVQGVIEARVQAELISLQVAQRIRLMLAELQDDTVRADRAMALLDLLDHQLSPEDKSAVAADIIRKQLGHPNPR